MSYCMKHVDDNERLLWQSEIECLSPQSDSQYFSIKRDQYVLDAGCGPGIFSRYLFDHYTKKVDAFDYDQIKIEKAKKWSLGHNINYFHGDITNLSNIVDNKYDVVISRYVMQHLEDPQLALSELKRVLRPGGKLIIIESSGVFFNIYSKNKFLNKCLSIFRKSFNFDLFVGDKINDYMQLLNFGNINVQTAPMTFVGNDRYKEIENYKCRFRLVRPLFEKIIGENDTDKFINVYLEELTDPSINLEYKKVVVEGVK